MDSSELLKIVKTNVFASFIETLKKFSLYHADASVPVGRGPQYFFGPHVIAPGPLDLAPPRILGRMLHMRRDFGFFWDF